MAGRSNHLLRALGAAAVLLLAAPAQGQASCSAGAGLALAGRVVARLDNVAYSGPSSGDEPVAAVSVSSGPCTTTTDAAGRFTLRVGAGAAGAPLTLTASRPGFQTTWISVNASGEPANALELGLYGAAAVPYVPGLVKGVFTHDAGGYIPDIYARGMFETTYDRIRSELGANLVAVSDVVWVWDFDVASTRVTMSRMMCATCRAGMFTREQYTRLVAAARTRGMAFMMAISVFGNRIPDGVAATETTFWDAWFAAYEPYVVEYAGIARDLGIEYLALAMGVQYMTQLPVRYWQRMVAAVRAAGYTGKLVYQPQVKPNLIWNEVYAFNDGTVGTDAERTAKREAFMRLFDVIVLGVTNVARGRDAPPAISREEMRATLRATLAEARRYPARVMVMLGTPSVVGGAVSPEYVEPNSGCAGCTPSALARTRDDLQQADVYQALFEVVAEIAADRGNFDGVISWGYWYTPDNWGYTFADGTRESQSYDKSSSIRGKPAEAVARWWFDRFEGRQSECLFAWAEAAHPTHLWPTPAPSAIWQTYRYRFYAGTGAYLGVGVADPRVYYLGPLSSAQLSDLGPAGPWYLESGCL